jgi:hypothetical protein
MIAEVRRRPLRGRFDLSTTLGSHGKATCLLAANKQGLRHAKPRYLAIHASTILKVLLVFR